MKGIDIMKDKDKEIKKDIDIFCEFLGNVSEETKQEILNGDIQIRIKFKEDGSLDWWGA